MVSKNEDVNWIQSWVLIKHQYNSLTYPIIIFDCDVRSFLN